MLRRIGAAWARRRFRPSERCALKDHMPASRHGERLPWTVSRLVVPIRPRSPPDDAPRRHCRQLPAARRLGTQSGAIWPDLGPRWVRVRTVAQGRGPSRTGASGREKPQVIASPAQAAGMIRQAQIVVPKVGGSGLSTRCREPSGSWPRGGGHRGRASPPGPAGAVAAASMRRRSCRPCHRVPQAAVTSGQSRSLREGRHGGYLPLTSGVGAGRNCMACKGSSS
jgi:hypothetical protein